MNKATKTQIRNRNRRIRAALYRLIRDHGISPMHIDREEITEIVRAVTGKPTVRSQEKEEQP